MHSTYEKGLQEVADGVHAYLQPDGSWGWSNAGLVIGDGESLLVDTLFDLRLTREMLETMAPATGTNPITTVANTHANGDHCYGNQLVAGEGVEVIASAAAARELDEVPAPLLAALVEGADGSLKDFLTEAFGPFDFAGIETPPPTRTFSSRLEIEVADRSIELIEVGPAHTAGDVIAWVPSARVVFTGDILFIGGTPVMWAGPVTNWIAACELIQQLDAEVVVPGHGPLTDGEGAQQVADYLRFVRDGVAARHAAGMSSHEAVLDIDADIDTQPFADWTDRERVVANVETLWQEIEPDREKTGILELLQRMADYKAANR